MTETPWSRALTRDVDARAIEAGWQRVRARRARPRLARAPFAAAAVLAVAALLFVLLRPSPAPVAVAVVPGPLTMPAAWTADADMTTAFEDGSHVDVAAGSNMRALGSDGAHVDLAIDRGSVTFDIKPGGPRAWRIDAGDVAVRVLGTRFVVERHDRTVDVRVERGKVSVEGARVPNGARVLTAGESIHVADAAPVTPDSLPSVKPTAPTAKKASATPAVDTDLMAQADAARREGRPRDAVALLTKVVEKKDARAPLAAFTLAKIEADDLGDEATAATWFERAAGLGLPSGLDEEALARAVECSAKAGKKSDASRLAERYAARFPTGRHSERVKRWSAP